MDLYVHPTALVESESIGAATRIWAFAHVLAGARIGSNCNIGDHSFIEGGAVIGNNCTIKNGNMIWEGITLEDGIFVGPGVIFTNDPHPRSPRLPPAQERYKHKLNWLAPTRVCCGATLGAGAVILPGLVIGEYATIGAGAVVTKSVPDYGLLVGNPGKLIGWVCQCGQKLRFFAGAASCGDCLARYRMGVSGAHLESTDNDVALAALQRIEPQRTVRRAKAVGASD